MRVPMDSESFAWTLSVTEMRGLDALLAESRPEMVDVRVPVGSESLGLELSVTEIRGLVASLVESTPEAVDDDVCLSRASFFKRVTCPTAMWTSQTTTATAATTAAAIRAARTGSPCRELDSRRLGFASESATGGAGLVAWGDT
ncbi:Uncharacterized protein PBTT_02680 [Plasmodiophora brassicae]|uniref:Uncharacterized protein n=1 Tax=Plasmodiophora brassicae TaxID=37360 RepID=A0A3P3Y6N0_PLABS|nr:unnamed protein product [Plasmodiophora brassicae]